MPCCENVPFAICPSGRIRPRRPISPSCANIPALPAEPAEEHAVSSAHPPLPRSPCGRSPLRGTAAPTSTVSALTRSPLNRPALRRRPIVLSFNNAARARLRFLNGLITHPHWAIAPNRLSSAPCAQARSLTNGYMGPPACEADRGLPPCRIPCGARPVPPAGQDHAHAPPLPALSTDAPTQNAP